MNRASLSIRARWSGAIGLGALLFAGAATADCTRDLASAEQRLEQAEGIDPSRRQALQGLRDMAKTYCDQGQTEFASRMIDALEQQIGQATGSSGTAADTAPSRPKTALTANYLAGMWCMSSSRHDRIYPIRFEPGGGHLVGQPAGDKYGMFPNGDELEDFYRGFDRLVSRERDEFVVIDRGRELTYRRGHCPGIEIAG